MLSVIIPSKNASNLMPCVEAVRKCEPHARVIVVDDGLDLGRISRKGECWCCHNGPVRVISGVVPFVFARNCNRGIGAAGTDDIILLNDDALLQTPGGFTAMQRLAQEHPEYGVISATTNVAGNLDQEPRGIGLRDAGARPVAFVCVLVPRRTLDLVGLLDERFTAYGYEDSDYCRRVRNVGLRVGIFDGCFVDHRSLTSTFRGAPGKAGNIGPGGAIYRQKWGDMA